MIASRFISSLTKVPSAAVSPANRISAGICTSPALKSSTADAKWRRERNPSDVLWRTKRNLPAIPNSFGPLTNLPDYTFEDGRPTPLGSNQKRRVLQQREFAKRIVELSAELDNAKTRAVRLQQEESAKREELIGQKLRAKGHRLL